jgi:hypothetical protein
VGKAPSYVERGLGEDTEELKKEIKRLRDRDDQAIAYEFGEGEHRVKALKDGKVWRVRDIYGNNLTRAGKFSPPQLGHSNIDWTKDEALKEAAAKAKPAK